MKLCVSEATVLPSSFAEDVANFASAGCTGMEVWLTKLEDHLQKHSVGDTQKLVRDHDITLAAAAYQGGLLLSQGAQRKAHFDHFRCRLELCQQFGIGTLLVVADFVDSVDDMALNRAIVSLKEVGQWAAGFGVKIGLEFRGKSVFCSSLDTAVALVEQCGEPNVGVNLDLFHYYVGPSKAEDFRLVTNKNLAFVQVCDLAGVPRELAADADRVLPGDGDFRFQELMGHLQAIKYDGWISLELMNPSLWNTKPTQVIELGMMALKRLIDPKQVGAYPNVSNLSEIKTASSARHPG